ncbi:MAG: site-specific DNA-methyltransferase, partial [Calditrichaeota bacterium]|nr:site-specific DNA-methyltransferase [Calditrichota bacterium]
MKRDDNKNVVREQLALFGSKPQIPLSENYFNRLKNLLQSNLDFHNQRSDYFSHNFHSFPAKFPPQLPKIFIEQLTDPFDIVLDPMAGSGTTIVEAFFSSRKGIGLDIDPLAAKISLAKITPLDKKKIAEYGAQIYRDAKNDFIKNKS